MSNDMRELFEAIFPTPWGVQWYDADDRYAIESDDDALWDSGSPDRESALEHISRWEGFREAWQSQQEQGDGLWFTEDQHGHLMHVLGNQETAQELARLRSNAFPERAPFKPTPLFRQSAPPAPAAVPEGWKLVPVEPTPEMFEAGDDQYVSGYTGTPFATPDDIYRAMLDAAPAPAEPDKDGSSD